MLSRPTILESSRGESSRTSGLIGRQPRHIALALLGWGVLVVISTTTVYIAQGGESLSDWRRPLRQIATYYYLWALASLAVYRFVDRYPFRLSRLMWLIPTHVALMAVLSAIITLLVHGSVWRHWLLGPGASGFQSLTISMYIFVVIGCLLLRDYRASLDQERIAQEMNLRATMLESKLSVARLDALRMQINPHFLFNALNSIASLIETHDNTEAYRTTELLGNLLRRILDQSHESRAVISDEIDFVSRYVEIERVRFGEKLRFDVEVGEDCLDQAVPALILQPIVENSIKHAVVPSQKPVSIHLRCELDDGELRLSVEDNGPGFLEDDSEPESGVGLENIRQRLRLLYGASGQLGIESIPGDKTTVTVCVPVAES